MNGKLMHLCIDSMVYPFGLFEAVIPEQNDYYIILDEEETLKNKLHDKIKVITKKKFLEIKDKYEYVFCHSLFAHNRWAAANLNSHVLVWLSWGGDIIGSSKKIAPEDVYGPETYRIRNKLHAKHNTTNIKIKQKKLSYKLINQFPALRNLYYQFITGELHPQLILKKGYQNIDFVVSVLESEQSIIKAIPALNAEYLWFSYGFLQNIVDPFYETTLPPLGKGVVVGHSAFYTSNHLDALCVLSEVQYEGPVFVPLAYGYEDYISKIMEEGFNLFGDNISFQLEPLPKAEYIKLLTNYHVLILNTRKQEAAGTLVTGLYLGMKLFLDPKGLLYQFCKMNDFLVFKLEDISLHTLESPLATDLVEHNRSQLEKIYGKENAVARTKRALDVIFSKSK